METWKFFKKKGFWRLVLILPMRNGNSLLPIEELFLLIGSYPTYEEWKPDTSCSIKSCTYWSFLSYLWGMETKEYITIPCKPVLFVLILPMRNGNEITGFDKGEIDDSSYPTYEEWKLETATVSYNCWSTFLSYLWGIKNKETRVSTSLQLKN